MSNAAHLVREVPDKPVSRDEVIRRWPKIRQSDLSKFDDCELSAYFSMRYENGWTTSPAARGTIEHRVFAECLREMQRQDSTSIPVDLALAILTEKLRQHGVAPEDRVRVPWRELPDMEMAVKKWAWDNTFTIRNLIDVERRLDATITYRAENTGELIERVITGQLDVLLTRGDDEAIVVDFKGTWGLPPEREEDDNTDGGGLSFHGFFQQRFYAVLVMRNFSSIMATVLREFYQRRSKARAARMTRQDLPKAEEGLSILVEAFDAALMAGAPPALTTDDLEKHGHWKPSPGKQCFNCAKANLCPIDDSYTDGGIRTLAQAEAAAGELEKTESIRKRLKKWCFDWAELHGDIPVKNSKGRRVLGHRTVKGGKRFEAYTPDGTDRPSTKDAYDPNSDLARAMQASVEEARTQREKA